MAVADKQQIWREKLIVRQNITSLLRYQKEQQIFEFFLPRLVGDDLQFYQITNLTTDLEFNQRYGFYESRSTLTLIEKDKIDVIVVPIVAFDQNNFRLGYGKGYYDRFLKNYHKMAIGLAFIEQLVTTPLPIEKHDIKIKTIISA
ncbi:5-formyltetrahydrofolate cyclo-ligase [Spiroplasma endosymbiont of Glossina fuscipes fuscipes]|uniref:5-formyltetrahydrofolate cyclo-ligase n=1 Tax=Spiroplasma endosymbiont of Glossina fuscipes fuscipes TaxID=2004463 RepID=UPI003C72E3A6